ncbi:TPA: hypothetical protein ACH3X1_010518 [Trebouxia sp. C0004]
MESQRQDFVQPGTAGSSSCHSLLNHLLSNRSCSFSHLHAGRMTQSQQDAVESQVGEGLKTCHESIQQLQHSISSINKAQPTVNLATVAHRQGVALILNESLQGATAMFNEAREQRHQQLFHQKQQQNRKRRRYNPSVQTMNYQMPPDDYGSADGMSSQQTEGPHQGLMQTESENRLLRHRLNTTQDQATGIESSLAEVAQLTELFTQQVMSQSEQIETLYDEAVAQTTNIEKGNVELKKAIKLSTSARKFTAVLMVVASLLILGFDWIAGVARSMSSSIQFPSSSKSRKLWVDCDAGVDDAQALLLALTSPNVELVGISAVHGNVGMSQVLRNIARVLTLCSRPDIPFYAGADEPLLAYSMDDAHQSQSVFHGNDGLGDAPNAVPTAASVTFSASPGYAYTKMIEAAKAQQGELILVVLGPLTNVALACKLDPHLPSRVKALYVMGGSAHKGNVTPTAEFNFHCDPEAAFLVLKKDTPRAKFLAATMANSSAYMKRERPQLGWVPCDPLVMAVAIDDSLIVDSHAHYVTVELHGSLTRGMTVIDWYGEAPSAKNVVLVEMLNLAVFAEMMKRSMLPSRPSAGQI